MAKAAPACTERERFTTLPFVADIPDPSNSGRKRREGKAPLGMTVWEGFGGIAEAMPRYEPSGAGRPLPHSLSL